MQQLDSVTWRAHARVDKWDEEQTAWVQARVTRELGVPDGAVHLNAEHFTAHGVHPYETREQAGNLLTTAGLTRLTSLLTGGGGQAATNTATRLGVGDGSGTAAVGDTDLSASAGSTHRWFQVMDATYPTVAAGVLTAKATWGGSDGNFAWSEWGIDIAAPTVTASAIVNATLLNHKTSAALGTKTSGTWALTATITIS